MHRKVCINIDVHILIIYYELRSILLIYKKNIQLLKEKEEK